VLLTFPLSFIVHRYTLETNRNHLAAPVSHLRGRWTHDLFDVPRSIWWFFRRCFGYFPGFRPKLWTPFVCPKC